MDTDMTMIAPYAFHNGDYHAAYHRATNTTFTVASASKKLSAHRGNDRRDNLLIFSSFISPS